MMERILKLITAGVVYFAIATIIAQVIMFAYIWLSWGMTWQRAQDAMDVARGKASIEPPLKIEEIEKRITEERPSFEEILKTRALKTRDFELRDEALSQGKSILRQDQDRYLQNLEMLNVAKTSFERQVVEYETKSQGEGLEYNVMMLSGIEAELAKVQLLTMYNNKEMEALVDIIKAMEPQKCNEILDTFTTKDDEKKLAEILRRIRDGFEYKPPVDNTAENLPPQT